MSLRGRLRISGSGRDTWVQLLQTLSVTAWWPWASCLIPCDQFHYLPNGDRNSTYCHRVDVGIKILKMCKILGTVSHK